LRKSIHIIIQNIIVLQQTFFKNSDVFFYHFVFT
jgi:hypothetical protein